MTELLDSLSDLNQVHFSAYRTALKLRTVQKKLNRKSPHAPTYLLTYLFRLGYYLRGTLILVFD